jgi:hypothetical protein
MHQEWKKILFNGSTKSLNCIQIRIEHLYLLQEKKFNTYSKWVVLAYLLPVPRPEYMVVTFKPSPYGLFPL